MTIKVHVFQNGEIIKDLGPFGTEVAAQNVADFWKLKGYKAQVVTT